jgi:integrase
MARPKKDQSPDLAQPCDLTAGAIERLTCPPGKAQAFLRDTAAPSLRVRVTAGGAKSFVFEAKLNRKNIRRTIGDVRDWAIADARAEARRLAVLLDQGSDPRVLERQQAEAQAVAAAEKAAQEAAAAAQRAADAMTVGEAWMRYVAERRPHWGDRTYVDHLLLAQAGGKDRQRGSGKTKPGPLASFMPMRLVDVTPAAVEAWAAVEAKARPARVRLAMRVLKAFLRWADAEPDLKGKADPAAASAKKAREVAGKASRKDDCLQREQLAAWFDSVRRIQNPVIAAYLQCLLLTGARREALAALRWDELNTQWKGMDLKAKYGGRYVVPLTPYVAHLLAGLPRRNEWVFSSTRTLALDPKNAVRRARRHATNGTEAPAAAVAELSATGRLVEPSIAHRQACAAAGLDGLTLHGLRRSFASLCEWLDIPGGVSAQIQGHAPQGVREQNYIRRPLDLLRVHHERIEAWMLKEARIDFQPKADDKPALRAVPAN